MIFETGTELGLHNVHLVTGEDIIGRVYKFEGGVRVERPVTPQIGVDPQSQQFRIGLMPLRPYAARIEQVTLRDEHIVFIVPVADQMEQLYTQFTSNITVVPGSALNDLVQ